MKSFLDKKGLNIDTVLPRAVDLNQRVGGTRRMVSMSLAGIGQRRFEEAANGLEAIERLVLGPADLMILDLNMPEIHGIEVLKFVRARPNYRSMPLLS